MGPPLPEIPELGGFLNGKQVIVLPPGQTNVNFPVSLSGCYHSYKRRAPSRPSPWFGEKDLLPRRIGGWPRLARKGCLFQLDPVDPDRVGSGGRRNVLQNDPGFARQQRVEGVIERNVNPLPYGRNSGHRENHGIPLQAITFRQVRSTCDNRTVCREGQEVISQNCLPAIFGLHEPDPGTAGPRTDPGRENVAIVRARCKEHGRGHLLEHAPGAYPRPTWDGLHGEGAGCG